MQDDYLRSRGFALTLARRAVEDLRRDEFRQLRNYVDLCQSLARKTRYSGFFTKAQQVLQRADSLYYDLIRCLLDRVDPECLCNFGVDFGVGGVVHGAAHLREETERTGQCSAWLNTANCSSPQLEEAVCRAEQAGRYVWVLYAQEKTSLRTAVEIVKRHPFSAFLLVAEPELLTSMPPESLDDCSNLCIWILLPAPDLGPEPIRAAETLLRHRRLFGFAVLLDDQTAERALDPEWLQEMARWASFCLYARKPDMGEKTAQWFRRSVVQSRTESATPLLVFDWDGDLQAVNKGISEQAVVGTPAGADLPFPFSCS